MNLADLKRRTRNPNLPLLDENALTLLDALGQLRVGDGHHGLITLESAASSAEKWWTD